MTRPAAEPLPALGVTIGKFNPFHLGHDFLITEAKERCAHLVVLITRGARDSIPVELRARWITECHPEVEVVITDDDLPAAPSPWAERVRQLLPTQPDVAFTSEMYGEAWATEMGSTHVPIDVDRSRVPVSGTALRADLGANFRSLSPPARAHFARRCVVMGAESTGTTSLAKSLAAHLNTVWVPEYGRIYWEGRRFAPTPENWTADEFMTIASGQIVLEEALARRANRVVIADTDPLATVVFHRRYRRTDHPGLRTLAAERKPDLYVVTAPDIPFSQDGTRESENHRVAMHEWFLDEVNASGVSYLLVTGTHEDRMAQALQAIEPLLRFPALT